MTHDERVQYIKSKLALFVPEIALTQVAAQNALTEVAEDIALRWEQELKEEFKAGVLFVRGNEVENND